MEEYKSEILNRFFGKGLSLEEENKQIAKMLIEVCDKNDKIKEASRKLYDRNKKMEEQLKDYNQIKIQHNSILGEFIGTLKGICAWDIPQELKEKLNHKINGLEKN